MHPIPSGSPKTETHSDAEITFYDMVLFLSQSWKKLIASLFIGAGLGLGVGFLFGTYSAEYIFLNRIQSVLDSPIPSRMQSPSDEGITTNLNSVTLSNSSLGSNRIFNSTPLVGSNINQVPNKNSYTLDLASWKAVQKSLPNLATQMMASGKVPEGQIPLYKDLMTESWWRKKVVPNFLAISKVDTKDLAGTIKDLEPDNFVLMSLTITESGRTPETALNNAQGAADFLRFGGAFIQVRNLLNSYEAEVIGSAAEIQKQITSTKIENGFLSERLSQLEELNKRFPSTTTASQLLIEPKESGAKYMPLSIQIIATKQEINKSKENIERLNQRLGQLNVIKQFLLQATTAASQNFNGLTLINQLLEIETKLRISIPASNISSVEILDQLRSQLLQIQGRFSAGIQPIPTIKSSGLIQAISLGSISTFLVTLFWLLGRQSWLNAKRDNHHPIQT